MPTMTRTIFALGVASLMLSACGGNDSDKVKEEYDRIEDQVKAEVDRIASKLTDNEKGMAEILESVFLPEESLDHFLDKLTPEGGLGGLYAGYFVEIDDGDDSDLDIGAIYFDISEDAAGSVNGRISYQQLPCQNNQTLATNSAIKVDNAIAGKLSGSLDTLAFLDMKYINGLNIKTPALLTTFSGNFREDSTGSPWGGSFQYQAGLGGLKLSTGKDDCDVTYTLSDRANFTTYPLDYQLGDLTLAVTGIGSQARLTWQNPANAAAVIVSQIDVDLATSGANGFVLNQVFKDDQEAFSPLTTGSATNYAFVVQAFDENNNLIAYQALVMDLP